jgi:hypothetical protein
MTRCHTVSTTYLPPKSGSTAPPSQLTRVSTPEPARFKPIEHHQDTEATQAVTVRSTTSPVAAEPALRFEAGWASQQTSFETEWTWAITARHDTSCSYLPRGPSAHGRRLANSSESKPRLCSHLPLSNLNATDPVDEMLFDTATQRTCVYYTCFSASQKTMDTGPLSNRGCPRCAGGIVEGGVEPRHVNRAIPSADTHVLHLLEFVVQLRSSLHLLGVSAPVLHLQASSHAALAKEPSQKAHVASWQRFHEGSRTRAAAINGQRLWNC